jgi:hypothetical protein
MPLRSSSLKPLMSLMGSKKNALYASKGFLPSRENRIRPDTKVNEIAISGASNCIAY